MESASKMDLWKFRSMTHEYGWQDVLMVNLACVAEPSEIQLSDALQDV